MLLRERPIPHSTCGDLNHPFIPKNQVLPSINYQTTSSTTKEEKKVLFVDS
jgi:hypothetical protein